MMIEVGGAWSLVLVCRCWFGHRLVSPDEVATGYEVDAGQVHLPVGPGRFASTGAGWSSGEP